MSHVLNACGVSWNLVACFVHLFVTVSAILFVVHFAKVPREFSMGTLRLSLGRYLAIDQTRRAVVAIIEAVTERKRTCNE